MKNTFKFNVTRTLEQTASLSVEGKDRQDAYFKILKDARKPKWLEQLSWGSAKAQKENELKFEAEDIANSHERFCFNYNQKFGPEELKCITRKKKDFSDVIWKIGELKQWVSFSNWLRDGFGAGTRTASRRFNGSVSNNLAALNDAIYEMKQQADCVAELEIQSQETFENDIFELRDCLEQTVSMASEALMDLSAIDGINHFRPDEIREYCSERTFA